jgi:ABC-type multidrug transport system fused ATPase/permease subunit
LSISRAQDFPNNEIAPNGDGAADADFPAPEQLRSRDVFRLVPHVWPFIRPLKRHLICLALGIVPGLPGGLIAFALLGVFFDVVGQGKPLNRLQTLMLQVPMNADRHVILFHACVFAAAGVAITMPYALGLLLYALWILQRMTNNFRVNLYAKLQGLSLRFHSEEKIGDAIFRMFQDSATIPQVINGLIIQPLQVAPLALVNIIVLAAFDYRVAAIAAALIPTYVVIGALFATPMRRAFLAERVATANATSCIEETLASIKTVKAFGREAAESELYSHMNWDAFMAARRARMLFVKYRMVIGIVRALAYLAAIYFGALHVLRGDVAGAIGATASLGVFQGALWIFGSQSGRVRNYAQLWGTLQDVSVAVARVLEMTAKLPEEKVRSGATIPAPPGVSLELEDLDFAYEAGAPVLKSANFSIHVGDITALAGASGAGKSTVVALMLRFYDPDAGRIALDGHDIRDFKLEEYRAMIAVALQENPLFTGTLRANLVYGRIDATENEIFQAVARAGLADFVRSLSHGLDTRLGEKGSRLSAGQAQRIGLARAFLRGAPILILDEPTSALDPATEHLVMRGVRDWIDERPRERMVLIATHRRSTAALADRIYRIANGRVTETDAAAFGQRAVAEASNG